MLWTNGSNQSKNFSDFQLVARAGSPEQEGREVVSPPSPPPFPAKVFLSMCPFFQRALEVLFMKEVTKNVHEN